MSPVAAALVVTAALACSWPVDVGRAAAKVMKCCPMDTILRIDMAACTGYIAGDQNARESYAWTSPGDDDDPDVATASSDSNENLALSLANGSFVPW